jgi:putative membrane protein
MILASKIMTGLVALIHLYIMWLEMFAWETKGKEAFKGSLAPELFKPTKTLAANQGLLAAGLIWRFFISDALWQNYVALFFLGCVAVAGLYGALTASKKILFIQTIPAAIGMILIWLRF